MASLTPASLPPPPRRLTPGNVPLSSLQLPETLPEQSGSSSKEPLDDAIKAAEREPHTWTKCPGAAFKVRKGPNYKEKRKKAPSAPALYEVFAVDVHASERKLAHIGRVVDLPADPSPPPRDAGLPSYVIINWMVPNYAPSGLLQAKRSDGPGWNLVLYCKLSDATREQLARGASIAPAANGGSSSGSNGTAAGSGSSNSASRDGSFKESSSNGGGGSGSSSYYPSIDLLRRFMHPTDGARLRGERLKCIMGLADTDKPTFGMVLKQLILRYNFKPFLSKTASFCYIGQTYYEIDIDIHTWGHAALSAFNTVKEKMAGLLPRVAVVVEADTDDEMPEQVIAGVYLTNMDPSLAPTIDAELAAYLNDEANHVKPLPRSKNSVANLQQLGGVAGLQTAMTGEVELPEHLLNDLSPSLMPDMSPHHSPREGAPGTAEAPEGAPLPDALLPEVS